MKFIWKFLKPFWIGILLSTLAITIATVCDLLLPTIMSNILDRGIYGKDMEYIVNQSMVMLVVALISMGATLLGAKVSCDVVAAFCTNLRGEIFSKVNHMSFDEFGKLGTAALVTRATYDVQTLSWVASELTDTIFTIPILFFGGFFLTLSKDILIALVLLVFLPIIFTIVILIGKKILPLWDKSDKYIDKQNDLVRERLRGIRVIRAFNAEPVEHAKIEEATHLMAENIIKSNVSMGLVTPVVTFLLNFATVIIIYLSGWRIETHSGLTGGDIFAIIQYIALVSGGVIMGAFTIINFPHAKVAAQRINQVLNSGTAEENQCDQQTKLCGDIQFDKVSFCFDGAADPALKEVSLHIKEGQKVAFIGGTGSGKSSLVSQILGFRKPTGGQVLFDGVPMDTFSIHTVRRDISCVLQNATMYSGSIGENVRMGKLDATDAEVWNALEIAQAADFVKEYEDGLAHEIKQSGKNLSGGQKQRIAIARAVIKEASIYIFDDSFSALDFMTEARLRTALNKHISGKTQIIITQRVTSAMHCDHIFVMDGGVLVDHGSHDQLLTRCHVYQQIYISQTGGAST